MGQGRCGEVPLVAACPQRSDARARSSGHLRNHLTAHWRSVRVPRWAVPAPRRRRHWRRAPTTATASPGVPLTPTDAFPPAFARRSNRLGIPVSATENRMEHSSTSSHRLSQRCIIGLIGALNVFVKIFIFHYTLFLPFAYFKNY